MKKINDFIGEKNNYDALRLFAAIGVIYSHSYAVVEGSHKSELIYQLSDGKLTLGTICVYVFFIISGFLITQSFARSHSLTRYFVNRGLRIVPGLTVLTLVTCLLMGPIVTTASDRDYWSSYLTYRYLANAAIYPIAQFLPGVFEEKTYPLVVNASLWTLCYEFSCYLFLAATGLIFRKYWLAGLIVLAISVITINYSYISLYIFFTFAAFFLFGGIAYIGRKTISLDYRIFLLSGLAIVFAFSYNRWLIVSLIICGTYMLIYIAYAKWMPFGNIAKYGDLSYGTYLYAWPVQQLFEAYTNTQLQNFLYAFPVTLILAAISWKLVEKPSLEQKESVTLMIQQRCSWIKSQLNA